MVVGLLVVSFDRIGEISVLLLICMRRKNSLWFH